ncbi:unnamed protein product [Cyclocybe aegerita]|uniref:Saccharopine dehydrogenase NADP binding domain-containing protein n=1 Tax=Cyclocybe aegerita TaxID=1973307 RepID=A0A8S0W4N9_CYCAE|nr:unnamed protein product [Cyclocybe aegerita]
MSDKTDLLVLGATGFTGTLITRYLQAHPQRSQFSLALGARSPKKLDALVRSLNLPASVKLVDVDVTNPDDIERAVRGTRVVINTVGPYWLWGTPVVRACVRNSVHYVDLTGEAAWTKQIIREFDYYATKTGAIIVPASGFDSVPSDISAYLANKTLKSLPPTNGEYVQAGPSTSAQLFRGGVSGGTIASAMTMIEKVPKHVLKEARLPYSLSPVVGVVRPPFKALYKLPVPGAKQLLGGFFVMAPTNRSVVQRTFGLLEWQVAEGKRKEAQVERYGPQFSYDEFQVMPSAFSAIMLSAAVVLGLSMLIIKPIRNLAKKYLPQSGEGPSEEAMQNGSFHITNITTSTTTPPVQVKTIVKGKGDPGYLLTAIMISESALSILLPLASESQEAVPTPGKSNNIHALTALAQQGGVLTSMTAFGDVLIKRLEETGRFEFSSSVVGGVEKKNV